jgi:hypothetical protein
MGVRIGWLVNPSAPDCWGEDSDRTQDGHAAPKAGMPVRFREEGLTR